MEKDYSQLVREAREAVLIAVSKLEAAKEKQEPIGPGRSRLLHYLAVLKASADALSLMS